MESNEIIITNHRAYIIDINLQEYFNKAFSRWDKIDERILNTSRRSYREWFIVEIEELIIQFNIEEIVDRVNHGNASQEELEIIDKSITTILNKATKKIEGPSKNIPYSKTKEIKRAQLLCW